MIIPDNEANRERMIECLYPILNVSDIKASITYYTKVLGFKKDWAMDTMAQVSREHYGIMFNQNTQPQPQEIWIGVEMLEPFYAEYVEQGATIAQEPTNHSWAYDMKIKDPDGHLLWFGAGPKPELPYEDQTGGNA